MQSQMLVAMLVCWMQEIKLGSKSQLDVLVHVNLLMSRETDLDDPGVDTTALQGTVNYCF